MGSFLTNLLNRITMYRLMLWFLAALLAAAVIESLTGILPYSPLDIILASSIIIVTSYIVNGVFAKLLNAYANPESTLITALILALIVGPLGPSKNILFLVMVSVLGIASKYVIAIRKRHIFNPAALGAVAPAVILGQGASWWIGSTETLLFVTLGGFLILAKLKRFTLALVFLASYLVPSMFLGANPLTVFIYSPIVFFTVVMLIEPLTSPVETRKQIIYAFLVGSFLVLLQQVLKVGYTLELALLIGNVFTYFASNPLRLNLTFKKKEQIARNTYSFYFEPDKKFNFTPGQFLHWTLPHKNADSRGIRRFFTICSSPTDKFLMITVKVPDENPSSFKKALLELKSGDRAVAIDPSGEFVLPKDRSRPLAFIAGGIGITPFISMAKWMVDNKESRDIVLLYSNSTENEVVFETLLNEAEKFGLKTVFVITKKDGYIDEKMIKEKVHDWEQRTFYISGPQPMVEIFNKMLSKMGVVKVKSDFFPGYTDKHQA